MKKIVYLISLFALFMASCSGGHEESLLKTVPADADMFAVVDLKAIGSDLGEDGMKQFKGLVEQEAEKSPHKLGPNWRYFFSDDSQVDFSRPMVIFTYNNASIATFYVKDAGKFRKGIEKEGGAAFQQLADVSYTEDGTVFISGNQAWFASSYPQVAPADIASFIQLGEADSALSLPCASEATGHGRDVALVVNVDRTLQGSWNRNARIVLNMLFDDVSYIVSYTDFEKGKAVNEILFLNYKGKPAPFALKTSKIDTGKLKDFEGKGNAFLAASLDPELVHDFLRQAKAVGLNVPPDAQSTLEQLEGNFAVSVYSESRYSDPTSVAAMLTFKSKDAANNASQLARTILGGDASGFRIFTDDKRLFIMTPVQQGESFADRFADLKGSNLGVVILPSFLQMFDMEAWAPEAKDVTAVLKDNGEGTKIVVTYNSSSDANVLSTLLKSVIRQRENR